ncbi:MAG: glycosyltransferase family 4 protein [Elusimicrobiaceae bacterium]|nr:glycosyltransferase family 4 protein [Elusimicrobiaceae bacterium]
MQPLILHIAGFAPAYGGNFIASLAVVRENCKNNGRDFALILPQEAQERPWCKDLISKGWDIHFITRKSIVGNVYQLIKICTRKKPKILHTHFTEFDIAAWLTAHIISLAQRRTIRTIWHIHSDFPIQNTFLRKLKDLIKFRAMGRSAYIIIVSNHLKNRPLAAGFNKNRIFVVANGISFDRLYNPQNKTSIFKKLGLKKDTTVLMFGWHPFIKGVDIALSAFEIVQKTRPDISLVIVGLDKTKTELARRYTKYPAWLYLIPPTQNVTEYFANANIFLSASRREGFPYSVAEAIACGCLIISSNIPALEWMKNNINCLWHEPENTHELASNILSYMALHGEDTIIKIVKPNIDFIKERYSAERYARNLVKIYNDITFKQI